MEKEVTQRYKIFTIIAGILTLISIPNIIYNYIGITNELLYQISFYITKIIGFGIYIYILKDMEKRQKIYLKISIILLVISIFALNGLSSVSGGLDSIGEALVKGMFLSITLCAYYLVAFALYISYAQKFIFEKKAMIRATIVLLVAGIILFGGYLSKTERVNESKVPSVSDFEKELVSRGICDIKCYTSYDTKLYGIKKGLDKADDLSFVTDLGKKYPLYVYATEEKENENNWIIYYINGNLYAVHGYYYVSEASTDFNEERKVIMKYPNIIVSENEDIITYNPKTNLLKKGKKVWTESLNYYAKGNDISVFVDYPLTTKYDFFEVKVVDKINKNTLDMIRTKD